MGKPGGIFALLLAVTNWKDGPAELRHLLLTLCVLSNHETLKGIYGQEAIGAAMGKAPRTVRLLLDQLRKHPSAPIKVHRRFRMRQDGRGRTSDEWTLELLQPTGNQLPFDRHDQPAMDDRLDIELTGNPLPLDVGIGQSDQPATECGPTGNERQDQPATHCQGSECGDRNVLSECDLDAREAAPLVLDASHTPTRKRTKGTGRTKAPETIEPTPATLAVARETGRDWHKDWAECRDWAWSNDKPKADWQATLRGWMRRNAQKQQTSFAPRKNVAEVQRGRPESIRDGQPSWLKAAGAK